MNTAIVKIWGKTVGAVAYDDTKGEASFEYEKAFVDSGLQLAPIKMPLNKGRIYNFPELARTETFKGMPGLLADVLPDKYGNTLINTWLARQGRPSNSLNPVETLCFIGKRGMGALEFEPITPKTSNNATKISIENLVQTAQDILSERKDFSTQLNSDEERAMMDMLKIGTSAGGARAKAIIAYNPLTKEVKSGQANAPQGFSHWLIKFDGVSQQTLVDSQGYGRVEMAYHLMASDCGIEMSECQLLEENGRAHFMTRRFDRPNEKDKLHVQTFCALQHYDFNQLGYYSYEQLFETIRILALPYPQKEQLYRRMLFNVMARNCDDHTKNFAFYMNLKGEWNFAPAYDLCYTYQAGHPWVSQHIMSINGKRKDFTKDDLLAIAKNMGIKKSNLIISQIAAIVNNWTYYAEQCKVDVALRDSIQRTLMSF
ncbi:MAG: type II toxin-antitoxin system HipA family toxin [Bacteroidota bacterium]